MIFVCLSFSPNPASLSGGDVAITIHVQESMDLAVAEAVAEFGKLFPNAKDPKITCFSIPTGVVFTELVRLSEAEGFEERLSSWLAMNAGSNLGQSAPDIERYVTNPTPLENTESYRKWMNLGL